MSILVYFEGLFAPDQKNNKKLQGAVTKVSAYHRSYVLVVGVDKSVLI